MANRRQLDARQVTMSGDTNKQNKKAMTRAVRPPSAVPVAPLVISQINCEAAVGLKPWRFLQFIAERNLRNVRIGKLVLVEAAVLLDAIRAMQADEGRPLNAEEESDRVLAAIGRKRIKK